MIVCRVTGSLTALLRSPSHISGLLCESMKREATIKLSGHFKNYTHPYEIIKQIACLPNWWRCHVPVAAASQHGANEF